jgi:hypothetical protein
MRANDRVRATDGSTGKVVSVHDAKGFSAIDLRAEAESRLKDVSGPIPSMVAFRRPYRHNPSIHVETLVIESRAGQVINAAAQWGDWDDDSQTIRLDDDGSVVRLDGSVVTPGRGP